MARYGHYTVPSIKALLTLRPVSHQPMAVGGFHAVRGGVDPGDQSEPIDGGGVYTPCKAILMRGVAVYVPRVLEL